MFLQAVAANVAKRKQPLHTEIIIHTTGTLFLKKKKKKYVDHTSVPLIFKVPTPETCKDEGSEPTPTKKVVSRYLKPP